MTTQHDWPSTLPFAAVDLTPLARSRSGGPGLSGITQVVEGLPIWTMRATVNLRSDAQVRALRKIRAQLRGQANRCEFDLASLTLLQTASGLPATTTTTATAAIGDTTLTIDTTGMTIADMEGGLFSVGDWLHEVSTTSGNDITFWPPLRAAVANGATVKITSPVFVGRLADDDGLPAPIGLDGYGSIQISFVEALER